METFDAIRTVLAVRHFKDTSIPEPIVQQIVEAGRLTASGSNSQPWHFIVVRDKETLRQLGQLARTGQDPISRRHRWPSLWLWIAVLLLSPMAVALSRT